MFESFTKPGSISTEEGEKAPDQVASNERNGCFKIEKVVNCDDIKRRRTHLDSMINFVDRNIETRLKAPTQQVHKRVLSLQWMSSSLFLSMF